MVLMTKADPLEEPCARKPACTVLQTSGGSDPFAEFNRAIRHLAVQRKISGTFFKRVAVPYLRLLSIAQTCRFQEKSFLGFLISGEKDVDKFKERKRPKASKPVDTAQRD